MSSFPTSTECQDQYFKIDYGHFFQHTFFVLSTHLIQRHKIAPACVNHSLHTSDVYDGYPDLWPKAELNVNELKFHPK
jgi:hypothetical protein